MHRIALRLALAAGLAPVAGCDDAHGASTPELTVYAAASLRDAVTELAQRFGAARNIDVACNFGGSGKLAMQVEHGGRADVFLSAGALEMDRLEQRGRIAQDSRRTLLSNRLVVVTRDGGDIDIDEPEDLQHTTRISIANPDSVPAGRYARAWLESAGMWNRLRGRVLPAVDVRAALAAIEHGGANVGIVYRTDAELASGLRIAFEVPEDTAPTIAYPAAVLTDSRAPELALAFLEHLNRPESREVFERAGFRVPDPR